MHIRNYQESDTEEIIKLFYDTVHEVNIRHYTQNQVNAWAPENSDRHQWITRLTNKSTYVAEKKGIIIGFGQLENNGHIDCFYCHKDWQRQGVGKQILQHIETTALSLGIKTLFTEASITAKAFFESQGFVVVREQEVERRGEKFINFAMEKKL